MQLKEIDNLAEKKTVQKISYRASQKQSERQRHQLLPRFTGPVEIQNDSNDDYQSSQDEKPALVLQNSESGAAVAVRSQLEKLADHRNGVMQRNVFNHEPFGPLINQKDDKCK